MASTLTNGNDVVTAVKRHRGKLLLGALGIVLLLAILVVAVVVPKWPFREADMRQRIEQASHSKATIGRFHQSFFPHPGCVLEDVILTPQNPDWPQVKIHRLQVEGLYRGLIGKRKHLRMLLMDGAEISFAPHSDKTDDRPSSTSAQNGSEDKSDGPLFDLVEATDSKVIFQTDKKGEDPNTYDIHKLTLKNFTTTEPIHYDAVLRIPTPPADVQISGIFGPVATKLDDAKLQGAFNMENADLAKFHALYGKLSAKGSFDGTVSSFVVKGSTDAPQFGVSSTSHALPLSTEFEAHVNGTNGDIEFQPIHAVLGKTKLVAEGKLEGDKQKVLNLDIKSNDGRIEDVMYLFVHDKPPLAGATSFAMKVKLPDDKRPFDQRVEMQAHFGIQGSKFTHQDTEQKVSKLAEQAQGQAKKAEQDDNPPLVVTNLRGDLKLKNGTANFSQLGCSVPGAEASLHGTYNLDSHAVDLHGTLTTSVALSKATTGFKSALMKVIEVAKKKDKGPATVPVSITGTYDKPSFGVDAPKEK